MIIGNRVFEDSGKTYIMGILNVTPDSFSDGGKYTDRDSILRQAQRMVEEGADIIDIGGESTRLGYTLLSEEEEIARVVPAIELVRREFDVPISLDTYKAGVASVGLAAGADLINDIWGLQYDPEMAGVIAKAGAACCLMHNQNTTEYVSLIEDVANCLARCAALAVAAGIGEDKIMLDPGVGFGKTVEQNRAVVKNLDYFVKLGYPVLLGTSRKSVIGKTLDLPITERVEGTIATSVMAVERGVSFLRVHDVQANRRAVLMAEAILREQ